MSYLVMECGFSYAVVMDQQGRFLKVANLGYEVGQKVEHVVELELETHGLESPAAENDTPKRPVPIWMRRKLAALMTAAACICFLFLGAYRFMGMTYGTVRMKINPDVLISVNYIDYVVGLEGLNEDGTVLIADYKYKGKKLSTVSSQLADRAMELGYLKTAGTITLTVESAHKQWIMAAEERVAAELDRHFEHKVTIHAVDLENGAQNQEPDDDKGAIPYGQPETVTLPAASALDEKGNNSAVPAWNQTDRDDDDEDGDDSDDGGEHGDDDDQSDDDDDDGRPDEDDDDDGKSDEDEDDDGKSDEDEDDDDKSDEDDDNDGKSDEDDDDDDKSDKDDDDDGKPDDGDQAADRDHDDHDDDDDKKGPDAKESDKNRPIGPGVGLGAGRGSSEDYGPGIHLDRSEKDEQGEETDDGEEDSSDDSGDDSDDSSGSDDSDDDDNDDNDDDDSEDDDSGDDDDSEDDD